MNIQQNSNCTCCFSFPHLFIPLFPAFSPFYLNFNFSFPSFVCFYVLVFLHRFCLSSCCVTHSGIHSPFSLLFPNFLFSFLTCLHLQYFLLPLSPIFSQYSLLVGPQLFLFYPYFILCPLVLSLFLSSSPVPKFSFFAYTYPIFFYPCNL